MRERSIRPGEESVFDWRTNGEEPVNAMALQGYAP